MKRKSVRILLGCIGTASLLAVSACGSSGGSSSSPASSGGSSGGSTVGKSSASSLKGPVMLGIVEPLTGPLSETAGAELAGAEVAVNQLNASGGIDGQKVKLVKENDQLNPAQDVTIMRQLNNEGVKLTLGFQITPQCEAAAQAAEQTGQLVIGSHCTGLNSGPAVVNKDFWGVATPTGVLSIMMGDTLAKQFPNIATWNVIGYDYSVGHLLWTDTLAQMDKVLERKIKIAYQAFEPLSTVDFSPQVSALANALHSQSNPKALFLSTYGGGSTSVFKEAQPYGILNNLAAIAQLGAYWGTAQAMNGTEPAVWNSYQYFWNCQTNPANTAFVSQFKALTSHQPDTGAYQGYESVEMYAAAIRKAGSDSASKVAAALPGLSIPTVTGMPMTMNGTTHLADQAVTTALLSGSKSAPDGIKVSDCVMKLASQY